MERQQKRFQIAAIVLLVIFLAGIFLHSIVLWSLNQIFPWEELIRYSDASPDPRAYTRLSLLHLGEQICGGCCLVGIIGGIILIQRFIQKGRSIPLRCLRRPVAAVAAVLGISTVPFALTDPLFRGNYLSPLWSNGSWLLLLFLVFLFANFRKQRQTV